MPVSSCSKLIITATVVSDKPIAYYPVNATVDPSGATATDLSGNGNNGTYVSNDSRNSTR